MQPMRRSQFTLGQLMTAIALLAIEAALVSASMHSTGTGRLLALIGAVWFLPFALMVDLSLRLECASGHGWGVRLFAKPCPRCARRSLVVERSPWLYECKSCGARFQRQRSGVLRLVVIPEDRGLWVGPYLKQLRELRRRMRPSAGLDFGPLPGSEDEPVPPSTPRDVIVRCLDEPPQPTSGRPARTVLFTTLTLFATAASVLALMIAARRFVATDNHHLFLVITIIAYTIYFCLMIGFMARFRWAQILLMLAVSAGLQAILLARAGSDLSWVTILGSSVFIPMTPLLLGALIASCEPKEAEPEDSTSSVLLRKVARIRRWPLITRREAPFG
jgi:hypothetical protein